MDWTSTSASATTRATQTHKQTDDEMDRQISVFARLASGRRAIGPFGRLRASNDHSISRRPHQQGTKHQHQCKCNNTTNIKTILLGLGPTSSSSGSKGAKGRLLLKGRLEIVVVVGTTAAVSGPNEAPLPELGWGGATSVSPDGPNWAAIRWAGQYLAGKAQEARENKR